MQPYQAHAKCTTLISISESRKADFSDHDQTMADDFMSTLNLTSARSRSRHRREADSLSTTGGQAAPTEDVYIAVMGVTGAGKSSFISTCTGKVVNVGNDLKSSESLFLTLQLYVILTNSKLRAMFKMCPLCITLPCVFISSTPLDSVIATSPTLKSCES